MTKLRSHQLTVLIIFVMAAGGIWARLQHFEISGATLDDIRRASDAAGLRVVGSFQEPTTGKMGLEVESPGCERPLALLPVARSESEIAPSALSYQTGQYNVSYASGGELYSESWINYKLSVIQLVRRGLSLIQLSAKNSNSTYLKVWTPVGCSGLTSHQIANLLEAKPELK